MEFVFFELRYWKKNSFSRGHLYVCNCIRKYGIMYSYMKFRNKTLICNFDDAIACVWPLLSRINYVPFFFFYFAIFCHQNYLVFFSTNIRDLEKNNKIWESRLKRMKLIDCVNKKANVSHKNPFVRSHTLSLSIIPIFLIRVFNEGEQGESESYGAMNGR